MGINVHGYAHLWCYRHSIVISSYKDLIVWQKSIIIVSDIYQISRQLPAIEQYGLSSQMQRAAVAIASNIAEGHRRNNRKEYRQFCGVALGSAAELETQLIITSRVYPKIEVQNALNLSEEIQKMLSKLIKTLGSA